MSADKVWVRTFKTGYKQVTLSQQPFDPAPCGYDDAEFTRTDLAQASVAAALEVAAKEADDRTPAKHSGGTLAAHCTGASIAIAIRALITPAQHDALAAHVAAEVAKARAEDAAKIAVLIMAGDVMANALRGHYIVPGSAGEWQKAVDATQIGAKP